MTQSLLKIASTAIASISDLVLGGWWLWSGVAHGLVFFLIGRMLVYGYREHSYLYQIETKNRVTDNWVQVLLPYVQRIRAARYREFIDRNLSRAGTRLDWNSSHFIASQILYASAAGVIAYLFLGVMLGISILLVMAVTVSAAFLPVLRLSDLATSRYRSCTRELPFFIDYLNLAMGAGLDFNRGLSTILADVKASPLRDEFAIVMRNMKLGVSREDALMEMQRRMDTPGLKLFVQTLVQAMKMGSDVGTTLGILSETIQSKRFQEAEEKAGKISVKMMIPMMVFVMPATMIILLGPMILQWLSASV